VHRTPARSTSAGTDEQLRVRLLRISPVALSRQNGRFACYRLSTLLISFIGCLSTCAAECTSMMSLCGPTVVRLVSLWDYLSSVGEVIPGAEEPYPVAHLCVSRLGELELYLGGNLDGA
jgi:hypothetical protein